MRDELRRSAAEGASESDQHRDHLVAKQLALLDVDTRNELQASEQLQVSREFCRGAEGQLQTPHELGGRAERVPLGDVSWDGECSPANLIDEREMTIERGCEGKMVGCVREVLRPMPYLEVVEFVHA